MLAAGPREVTVKNPRRRAAKHLRTGAAGIIITAALLLLFCTSAISAVSRNAESARGGSDHRKLQIPPGTILPVRLNHKISSKNARPGMAISARVMQDVPLPDGRKIPEGTKVYGHIVEASPAAAGAGRVSFRFDYVDSHRDKIPISTDLRAMASFMEVRYAQTPETTPGFGDPYVWSTTDLIGGGVKYGYGGPVTNQCSETAGKGTLDGVLAHVRAQPGTKCLGPMGEDRLQALWVFSSEACGVYGMPGVQIVHAGRTGSEGDIVLAAEGRNLKLPAGTALLLRVLSQ
jgi:hypothetical protein